MSAASAAPVRLAVPSTMAKTPTGAASRTQPMIPLVAHAVDADGLSQRGFAGEEPAFGFIADHRDAGVLEFVVVTQAPPRRNAKAADALVHGINSGEEQIGEGAGGRQERGNAGAPPRAGCGAPQR